MKKMKALLCLMLVFILTIGVCGCMDKKNNPEKIKDEIVSHLHQKYGKDFIPVNLVMKGVTADYDQLSLYPADGNKDTDSFYAYRHIDNGKASYKDNYFEILVRDEYEQTVAAYASGNFNKTKVFSKFNAQYSPDSEVYWPNELVIGSTLDDAKKRNTNLNSQTMLFVNGAKNKDDFISTAKAIEGLLKDKGMDGLFCFYLIADEYMNTFNRSNYMDVLPDYFEADGTMCLAVYRATI